MSPRKSSDNCILVKTLLRLILTTSALLATSSTSSPNEKNAFEHDDVHFSSGLMPPAFSPSMMDHPPVGMTPGLGLPPFLPPLASLFGGMIPPFLGGIGMGMFPGGMFPPVPPAPMMGMMMPQPHRPAAESMSAGPNRMIRPHPHTHGGMGYAHPYPSPHHGMYDPLMDPGMVGSGNSFPGIPLKDSPKCRVTCDRVCDPFTGCTSNCMRQCCTFEKISTPLQSDLPQHPTGVNTPPTYDELHPQFDPHHVPLHGLHGPHPHLHGAFRGYPVSSRSGSLPESSSKTSDSASKQTSQMK